MPRYPGKKADVGMPITVDRDRYIEGDSSAVLEGGVAMGEKPGNIAFPVQLDADGLLKIALGGDVVPGTEYADGDLSVGSSGTLILGDDGANVRNVSVGANGRLQVEVVVGEYDAVQYQDGAAVASPFGYVTLGHDGSNVYPVLVDASGHLQVDVISQPSDTFVAEGGALGKGVLLQGDDGTDRHNVAVDTSGHLQVNMGKVGITTAQIVVNISTATTTALKAAVGGHTYTIMTISLTVAAENNLTFKSNTTAISGPMDFGASGESHGWQANLWPVGLKCASGEALNLLTSTTGQVSGFITILDES